MAHDTVTLHCVTTHGGSAFNTTQHKTLHRTRYINIHILKRINMYVTITQFIFRILDDLKQFNLSSDKMYIEIKNMYI